MHAAGRHQLITRRVPLDSSWFLFKQLSTRVLEFRISRYWLCANPQEIAGVFSDARGRRSAAVCAGVDADCDRLKTAGESSHSFYQAHSITLALATLGVIHVPPAPTEAIITLSILFLAVEIIHSRQGKPGITEQYPWIVAFLFGLFHGLGS